VKQGSVRIAGHVNAHCLVCRRDVFIPEGSLKCPYGDHDVEPTSLARMPPTANGAQEAVPAPDDRGGAAQVTLPPIREARAWDAATEALLTALEREEAGALVDLEAAKVRARNARRAAAAFRQLRGLVAVEPAAPALRGAPVTPTPAAIGEKPWSQKHPACVNCGTTSSPHQGRGRCAACAMYFRTRGVERPRDLWGPS
jgi:hypothetical protein